MLRKIIRRVISALVVKLSKFVQLSAREGPYTVMSYQHYAQHDGAFHLRTSVYLLCICALFSKLVRGYEGILKSFRLVITRRAFLSFLSIATSKQRVRKRYR